ncbi:MAG TPA: 6-phosphogluconolactonase [Stellaceae bacterium]|nr:6-phosphogluconolactonase [Stellaceae bacterium]
MRADPVVTVLPDPIALAAHVAQWLIAAARAKDGPFAVALSGGSTPRTLYRLLAEPLWSEQIPWKRVHWFWGDERFVPKDHPDSNFRMVREVLLSHVPVPPENVHPIPTHGEPEAAAEHYAHELRTYYEAAELDPHRPLFDVTLLGLGDDGHTASLFPGNTAALTESTAWVTAVVGAKPEPRISLTYPALNSSATAAFLITGAGKHAMVERLKAHDPALPASGVRPLGDLHIFLDHAAASGAGTP